MRPPSGDFLEGKNSFWKIMYKRRTENIVWFCSSDIYSKNYFPVENKPDKWQRWNLKKKNAANKISN